MVDDPMPSPPFPDPDSHMLSHLLAEARTSLDLGDDPLQVVLQAAVHAWMEGHIEGEHYCATGCPPPAEPGREEFAVAVRHATGGSRRISQLFDGQQPAELTATEIEAGRQRAVEAGHLDP